MSKTLILIAALFAVGCGNETNTGEKSSDIVDTSQVDLISNDVDLSDAVTLDSSSSDDILNLDESSNLDVDYTDSVEGDAQDNDILEKDVIKNDVTLPEDVTETDPVIVCDVDSDCDDGDKCTLDSCEDDSSGNSACLYEPDQNCQ